MQRTGAAFPEAHLDPERMAKLAAFVSLEIGFDMVFPVFSVVHEAAALGADVDWGSLSIMPSIRQPLWSEPEQITISSDFERHPAMTSVLGALRLLKDRHGQEFAVVGKTFGPWSLAYHLFGVEATLMMTIEAPGKLEAILGVLTEVTLRSARAQIEAGADVLCLGDHCSRDMCSPGTYRRFLFQHHREIAQRIPCPLVLHTCGQTGDRIADFARTGLTAFHYDTRVPVETVTRESDGRLALMGGISNVASLRAGDVPRIEREVRTAVAAGIHVIGPECAIPLDTTMAALGVMAKAPRTRPPA